MGKKSKRRGVAQTSKNGSHQSRVQERRERQLLRASEEPPQDDNAGAAAAADKDKDLEFFVGDRVWYRDPSRRTTIDGAPRFQRGIVVESDERLRWQLDEQDRSSAPVVVTVVPMDADPDSVEKYVQITATPNEVPFEILHDDVLPLTLRFDVGDRVVCNGERGWEAATVRELHAVWKRNSAYLCDKAFPVGDDDIYIVVPEDTDDCIRRRKDHTRLRFQKSDHVLFDSSRAFGFARPRNPPWVEGQVIDVDLVRPQVYAVYEIAYQERGRRHTCFILQDDDQHVTSATRKPRDRFLDAIEQDCSYEHFENLVLSFGLDMLPIQDLVLERSLEHACYGSLLWLQEHAHLDLHRICSEESGRGLTSRVSRSAMAERYFRKISSLSLTPYHEIPKKYIEFEFKVYSYTNRREKGIAALVSILKDLVDQQQFRLLALVCCPVQGLAWEQRYIPEELLLKLRDSCRIKGQHECANLIESLVKFKHSFRLASSLLEDYIDSRPSAEDRVAAQLWSDIPGVRQGTVIARAKVVIRFCRRWLGFFKFAHYKDMGIQWLCRYGKLDSVRLFLDADPLLASFDKVSCTTSLTTDRGEYLQPELKTGLSKETWGHLNLVDAVAHGDGIVSGRPDNSTKFLERAKMYLFYLEVYFDTEMGSESLPIVDFLAKLIEDGTSSFNKYDVLVRYRLWLQSDDEGLTGRLRVLDFLVKEKGMDPPSALNAVRWRRCGVLRWLVDEKLVDLQSPATLNISAKDAKTLQVLDGHPIPSTMQLGVLLCFCCIEFDDLQSLEWLVMEKGIDIETFSLYGWNVGHACAFFGRSEMTVCLWKLGRLGWDLVMTPCDRKPNQNAYAVHIAVNKGFIFIADVLLRAGSPMKDERSRDFMYYAKRSGHKFVVEYVQSLKNPLELETDIRCLLQIHAEDGLLYEKTKKFLVENRCLAMERWRDSGYQSSEVSGPLGMTFREVLSELCCPEHPELITWLYMELAGEAKQSPHRWPYFWMGRHDFSHPSEGILDADGLRSFALEAEDEKLMSWLGSEWASGIHAKDPAQKGSLLAWLQNICGGHNECLAILRAEELRGIVIHNMRESLDKLLQSLLVRGEELQTIERLVKDLRDLLFEVLEVETRKIDNKIEISNYLVQADGKLNAKVQLIGHDWESNLMEKMMRFRSSGRKRYCRLSVFLVVEGYEELVQWLVEKQNALDLEDSCEAVNVAAYMGHVNIVRILLGSDVSFPNRMLEAALFGAVEGGRGLVLDFLTRSTEPLLVPPKDPFLSHKIDALHSYSKIFDLMQSSLVLAAVFGCLNGPQESPYSLIDVERASVLQWMLNEQQYDPLTLLQVIPFGLKYTPDGPNGIRCSFALAQWVIEELGAAWWQVTYLAEITREALAIVRYLSKEDQDAIQEALEKWLSYLVSIGFNILAPLGDAVEESYVSTLSDLRLEQVRVFSQFEVLKQQQPLSEVKRAIQDNLLSCTCRDKGGLLITHVAAAYNRVDVLELVVEEMGMPLKATDLQGRDALAVAQASNATESVKWIANHLAVATISRFCSSNFLRRKESIRYQELVDSILTIQSWYRAEVVRRLHRLHLESRMKSSMAFRNLWKVAIDVCDRMVASAQPYHYESWEALKESQCDFLGLSANEDERVSKRIQRQDAATESALLSEDINVEDNVSDCDYLEAGCSAESSPADDCMVSERVYLTNDVLKWLRVADTKYRTFFSRQVKRLAAGERGRKLAKRLIGTHQSLIYEAYLEQKAGHRILWTPSSDHQSLLIWYVVAHDDVSRFMKLIDNSENRSSRQQTDAASIVDTEGDLDPAANNIVPRRVQLDPRGNTPLKLFEVLSDEIECLADKNWVPQLYLTDEELNIIETKGTVLVLGRSGTGKTICIGNRMEYDRRRFDSDMSFSQLFVARSQRLCSFVKASVEESTTSDFKTFDQLLRSLERTLPNVEGSCHGLFLPSQKVDFQKFKREVHSSSDNVDALIVWSSIRSFIKGSIQALQQTDRVLSEAEYMDLGKRRCRLSREQREVVYKTFLRYDQYMKEHNFWDDMDRVAGIIERLEKARSIASPEFDLVRHTKVYVDEVQDYTQAEIYIFFLLSGPGDLFLAGDPCQSVVEGVEFRFEEIRSVGFYVCGTERRHLIPEKPKTVNVNFRSHSGILQTAAAVLSFLFGAFPDSAKQLKEDHGLFSGPRPGVFSRGGVSFQHLREAISAGGGIVVLTHDAMVPQCKDALGGYPLVYGIREAKGLEFQSVVLVNFFSELPRALQKPWRDLLLGRTTDDVDFSTRYPEVEGQLKLLYTAITRCMHRLFFAETQSSIAGDAFVRWLTTGSTTTTTTSSSSTAKVYSGRHPLLALGTRCSLNDVEKMQQTPDDWRSAGFDNAIMAEADLDAAEGWMEKAIYCFQQAEDIELASKARVYKASVQCRASLQRKNYSDDQEEVESEVAQLIKSLLVEHLVGEAVLLCHAALPFLPPYSQEQVTEQLLHRLAKEED